MDLQKQLDGLSLFIEEIQKDVGGFLNDKIEELNAKEIEVLIKKFEFYIQKMNEKVESVAKDLNFNKQE